jgi:undecaprenyl-diphosphatase
MPSNHAANAFAAAETVGSFEPLLLVPLLGIAALIAYSRVYVGVHYPSDVIVAALIGLCVGWACARTCRRHVPAAPEKT